MINAKKSSYVRECRLDESRVECPHASRHICAEESDLRVDAQPVDAPLLIYLPHQQERGHTLHHISKNEEEDVHLRGCSSLPGASRRL